MPNLTSVTVTAGLPTAGTGTVSTIDNIPSLWDKGVGTGGTLTQRIAIDTAQLAALSTTAQTMSAGYQLVAMPTDGPGLAAEDSASASGDIGFRFLAIQRATPADTAADLDYSYFQMSGGRLWASTQSYGDIAHDAADSGNPLKNGYKATTALSGLTLVADADRTNGFAGVDGVQITRPHCNLEDIVSGNATNTDGTSTQCIAAQSAGIKTYLSSIVLCNTSATAITVDIKDGTTVKVSLPLPAGTGTIYNPPIPIPGTAATAWNFDGSAAATTITCSMLGFKSKV